MAEYVKILNVGEFIDRVIDNTNLFLTENILDYKENICFQNMEII